MDASILWGIIGVLSIANLVVSAFVLRSRYYSIGQKLAQCFLVWLLPIVGTVGVWVFLRTQEQGNIFDTRAYPEPSEKMVAAEVDSTIHDSFGGGGEGGGGDGH